MPCQTDPGSIITFPSSTWQALPKGGTADDTLHVLDTQRFKTWTSSPKETAHKRDFHAIDAGQNVDPMMVEKFLSQLEGKWSAALHNVISTETPDDDDTFAELMVFVAFMAMRVLRIREIVSGHVDEVSKAVVKSMLATDEGRANFRKIIEGQGEQLSDEHFEEVVQFGLTGEYEVNFEQFWHVQMMVDMACTLGRSDPRLPADRILLSREHLVKLVNLAGSFAGYIKETPG